MTTLIGPYNRQKTGDGRAMRPTLVPRRPEEDRMRLAIVAELKAIAARHKARGLAVKAAAVEAAARRIRESGR